MNFLNSLVNEVIVIRSVLIVCVSEKSTSNKKTLKINELLKVVAKQKLVFHNNSQQTKQLKKELNV